MRYALVHGNQVKRVGDLPEAVVAGLASPMLVPSDTAEPGDVYVNGEFVKFNPSSTPGIPTIIPNPPLPVMTRFALRQRLTMKEKVAIYTAKATNVGLEVWLDDLKDAQYVDPWAPTTITAVFTLEQNGLLEAGRAREILTAEITADEMWTGAR